MEKLCYPKRLFERELHGTKSQKASIIFQNYLQQFFELTNQQVTPQRLTIDAPFTVHPRTIKPAHGTSLASVTTSGWREFELER
jgi:hypothetical protein